MPNKLTPLNNLYRDILRLERMMRVHGYKDREIVQKDLEFQLLQMLEQDFTLLAKRPIIVVMSLAFKYRVTHPQLLLGRLQRLADV